MLSTRVSFMVVRVVWGITEVARWHSGWSDVDHRQVNSSEDSLG